jgi:hypothetical protein
LGVEILNPRAGVETFARALGIVMSLWGAGS